MRACWSESHLYVGFYCVDADIWGTYAARDDPLYEEEVVEVFLCPSGDLRHYFEIEVSPRRVRVNSVAPGGMYTRWWAGRRTPERIPQADVPRQQGLAREPIEAHAHEDDSDHGHQERKPP